MRSIIATFFFLGSVVAIQAQSAGFAFGAKGGLSVGLQSFNGFERDPLTTFHGAAYIESLNEDNSSSLMAQVGYHGRGSAVRVNSYVFNGQVFPSRSYKTQFYNASLLVAVKKKNDFGYDKKWYYLLGLRLEYNLDHDFELLTSNVNTIKDWVYGFSAGGGIEWMLSDLAGGFLELTISPDLSNQIFVPAQQSPYNPNRLLPESNVKNITFELSLGVRLLNKYEYY